MVISIDARSPEDQLRVDMFDVTRFIVLMMLWLPVTCNGVNPDPIAPLINSY